jgi:hypothetical protein
MQSKTPCRDFAQGSCRFGANCKFSHDGGGGGGGQQGGNQQGGGGYNGPRAFNTQGGNQGGYQGGGGFNKGGQGGNQGGFQGRKPFQQGGEIVNCNNVRSKSRTQTAKGNKKCDVQFFCQGKLPESRELSSDSSVLA